MRKTFTVVVLPSAWPFPCLAWPTRVTKPGCSREDEREVRPAGRLANQDRKQTSARKPSSGEVSAARWTGAGKTSTAAPQNGQNEPHYHPQEARATCG